MCFLLLLPTTNVNVAAEDISMDMIIIPSTSKWTGTVGGDVGGKDKITSENFLIKENDDQTVNMSVKNNRGKISSTSEGIAYYYQQVNPLDNYELTANVKIDSIHANDQVGFRIMLRGNLLNSTEVITGDYLALGGIKQSIKGFYKYKDSSSTYPAELDFNENKPITSEEYTLKIRKDGNIYQLTVGEETKTITDYTGEINYVGLFAARNASVTYSNIELKIDRPIETGEWEFRAFGGNTSDSRNPAPIVNDD